MGKDTQPSAAIIGALGTADITEALVGEATDVVLGEYQKLGATDRVAKGAEFKKGLAKLAQDAIKAAEEEKTAES